MTTLTYKNKQYHPVEIIASNNFAKNYLYKSDIEYIFCGGKMGGFTYTNCGILIPEIQIKEFKKFWTKYSKKKSVIEESWNWFFDNLGIDVDENKIISYYRFED